MSDVSSNGIELGKMYPLRGVITDFGRIGGELPWYYDIFVNGHGDKRLSGYTVRVYVPFDFLEIGEEVGFVGPLQREEDRLVMRAKELGARFSK